MKPTLQQQMAIDNRGGALLVSAAAGSGKTRVLIERLMGYLAEGHDLEQFLLITYTKAAAAEMKGRMAKRILEQMRAEPTSSHWQRQFNRLPLANISTIHAYCSKLLREQAAHLDIGTDFRLCDEQERLQIEQRVLDRVLEDCYNDNDADFSALVDNTTDIHDDRQLCQWMIDLHNHANTHADPEDWLRQQAGADYADLNDVPWVRDVLSRFTALLDSGCTQLKQALELLHEDAALYEKYIAVFKCDLQQAQQMLAAAQQGWDALRSGALAYAPLRLNGSRDERAKPLQEQLKPVRDSWKELPADIAKALTLSASDCLAQCRRAQPVIRGLCAATLRYQTALEAEMRRLNLLTFNDLEHLTLRLLTQNSDIAQEVSRRFIEISVDEVQDISALQEQLIVMLSRQAENIVWVGDVRQSIYRFRLAEPQLFIDKYNSYQPAETADEGQPRRILLNTNFRSRGSIIDLVNTVFSQLMSPTVGEMAYTRREYLETGAGWSFDAAGRVPQLVLFDAARSAAADDDDGEGEQEAKQLQEARWIARRIADLCNAGAPVDHGGDGVKPIRPGDCAILLRATSGGLQGLFEQALRAEGIPYCAKGRENLFESPEALVLLSYLEVLNNPTQDVPLIAVLRSPLYYCNAEQLVQLRTAAPHGSFFAAMQATADETTPWRRCYDDLMRLRFTTPDSGVGALVWSIMETTNMLALYAAQVDGAHRCANLMTLVDMAQAFESEGRGGLFAFVSFLRRLAEEGYEVESDNNVRDGVHIMTIHGSKGLEFPYVFLADSARRFNTGDETKPLLLHAQLGLGLTLLDDRRTVKTRTAAHHGIARRLHYEMLSEAQRLLYVALTRAREQLYITATLSKADDKYRALLTPRDNDEPLPITWVAGQNNFAAWLCGALTGLPHICGVSLADKPSREPDVEPAVSVPEDGAAVDDDALGEVTAILNFKYAHTSATTLPSKATATGLRRLWSDAELLADTQPIPELLFERPQFVVTAKGLTGAERGSAAHLALQCADLSRCTTFDGCAAELDRLAQTRLLVDQQRTALSPRLLFRFAGSPLARRMMKSPTVWREKKFSLLVDADTVTGQAQDADEQILLQGVIDCCFAERDGWVLIDYKTDAVTAGDEATHSTRYLRQLAAYAMALERMTGRPVADALLYYTATGQAVSLIDQLKEGNDHA